MFVLRCCVVSKELDQEIGHAVMQRSRHAMLCYDAVRFYALSCHAMPCYAMLMYAAIHENAQCSDTTPRAVALRMIRDHMQIRSSKLTDVEQGKP
jgi:hypothetical protein